MPLGNFVILLHGWFSFAPSLSALTAYRCFKAASRLILSFPRFSGLLVGSRRRRELEEPPLCSALTNLKESGRKRM
jgi:hypothetical protein